MDGALGKGPDGMSEIADISVAPTPRLSRTSFQHVPLHSVDACIEIVGAAIVRHVFGDIGVATARQKSTYESQGQAARRLLSKRRLRS